MVELWTDRATVGDVARPRYHHAIAGTAEVRSHNLCPLKRRVHRVCPADRIMVVAGRAAKFVHVRLQICQTFRNAVAGDADLVGRALQATFGAGPVVALDKDDDRVVVLA